MVGYTWRSAQSLLQWYITDISESKSSATWHRRRGDPGCGTCKLHVMNITKDTDNNNWAGLFESQLTLT